LVFYRILYTAQIKGFKSMSGCGSWNKRMRSVKLGLAGLVGLNLLAGLANAETSPVKPAPEQDGIYLYGEANTVNQLGKGYFIFQQSGQKVVGAMYYPHSEYTCFTGQRTATNVHLQAFEAGSPSSSGQDTLQVSLPQLHKINRIGPSERQTLAACQQEAAALQPSRTVVALPRP
jgi:hypothetical protein